MTKHVWILGAGFSAPLGGPLFNDLFSPANESLVHLLESNFQDRPNEFRRKLRIEARKLYKLGKDSGRWHDPEQFLQRANDAIEASSNNPLAAWILNQTQNSERWAPKGANQIQVAKAVLRGAKEQMAIETSLFLCGCNLESEMWRTYREWFGRLNSDHSIVTFNYDEAIECIAKSSLVTEQPKLLVHLPDGTGPYVVESGRSSTSRHVDLFKLHGSAGWIRQGDDPEVIICDEHLGFISDGSLTPVIYTPGPEKMAGSDGNPITTDAMNRIREARSVHFVGYRFPESDMFALGSILDAIRDSKAAHLNIVLGPSGGADVARMEALLKTARDRVTVHPMWSQDYLKVFDSSRSV